MPRSSLYLAAACALAGLLVTNYLPAIFYGFWIDETGSVWMAAGGLSDVVRRCMLWPGQSITFAALQSFFYFPNSPYFEPLFRLPALLALLAVTYVIFRLGKLLHSPTIGLFAVVLFLAHPSTVDVALQARPYSLALLASTASLYFTLRWRQSLRHSHLAAALGNAILAAYFHYLFFTVAGLTFLVYLEQFRSHKNPFRLAATSVAATIALLLPLVIHVRASLGSTQLYEDPLRTRPGLGVIFHHIAPAEISYYVTLGLLLSAFAFFRPASLPTLTPTLPPALPIFTLWIVLSYFLFGAVSRFTSADVFLARYLYFLAPAVCAVLAFLIHRAHPHWAIATLLVITWSFLPRPGLYHPIGDPTYLRELKTPIAFANSLPHPCILFIRSPIVESNKLNWRATDPTQNTFHAPTVAYPSSCQVRYLPFNFVKAAPEVLAALAQGFSEAQAFQGHAYLLFNELEAVFEKSLLEAALKDHSPLTLKVHKPADRNHYWVLELQSATP
jgi:hypothetical protein